jgi:hypothetical protein
VRTPHPGRLAAAIGIALLVVVAIALTGTRSPILTTSEQGSPRPAPLSAAQTTTSTVLALPPRPGTLPLDGVDPCSILTAAQRAGLSLDSTPVAYTDTEFDEARACAMRDAESGTETRLALVVDMGVDVWVSAEAQVRTQSATVVGYPALVVRTPGLDDACDVDVDTGAHQFLDVLYRDGGNDPPIAQDTLCLGARRVADAAVASLKSRG